MRNPQLTDQPQAALEQAFQEAADILRRLQTLVPTLAPLENGKQGLEAYLAERVNTLEELRSSILDAEVSFPLVCQAATCWQVLKVRFPAVPPHVGTLHSLPPKDVIGLLIGTRKFHFF